ncbi:MAG TPA: hypothetical protein VGS62_07485 [Streptosporangiaceae bacterium]|nr:hypothetical protein [Streptosporangiaceae bacterium]
MLTVLPLSTAALLVIPVYCGYFGLAEWSDAVGGLRPPSTGWQVPQSLVLGASRRRRILVWGAILGPGFVTRNPYAGFGLLPLLLAALGDARAGLITGAAIGACHGAGRALALLRDTRQVSVTEYLQSVLKSMYWRRADGLALLALGGIAVVMLAGRF